MSLNTAHANGGVLIHAGECILVFSDNVTMEFHGNEQPEFHGKKTGRLYLTTHRMVFNVKDTRDKMQSFSFPFITLSNVELEQPVFGANFIKGKVRAQPNGNWIGEAKFKLMFKTGGAIDFGQAMLRAAQMASRNGPPRDAPPPYTAPMGDWYAAPPPAYAPPPAGYYGWTPPSQAFPDAPPPNSVFMTDNPPPYPGINGYNGYAPAPQQQPMGYQQQAGYAPQGAAGYAPQGAAGFPQQYPNAPGYAPQQQGYPPQQQGYPPQQQGYPPQQQGYPPQQQGYPPQQQGYPPQQGYTAQNGGAMGFVPPQNNGFQNAPSAPDAKAAEAAQSAYYDPSQPQCAYVPPPAYYESPPTYQTATTKKDQ